MSALDASVQAGVTCRGSIALGSGCRVCRRCRDELAVLASAARPSTPSPRPKVGQRRVAVTLSRADLRALVGAPDDAIVEIGEHASASENDEHPDEVAIRVKWGEQ